MSIGFISWCCFDGVVNGEFGLIVGPIPAPFPPMATPISLTALLHEMWKEESPTFISLLSLTIPYFYITNIVYNTDLLMVCVWGLSLRPWGPSSKVSNLERWPFMLHFKILQCLVAKMPSICPTSNDFRNAPAGQLTFWQECHLPFGPDSSCGVTLYIEIQAQRDRYPLPALFCYDDQFFFSNP